MNNSSCVSLRSATFAVALLFGTFAAAQVSTEAGTRGANDTEGKHATLMVDAGAFNNASPPVADAVRFSCDSATNDMCHVLLLNSVNSDPGAATQFVLKPGDTRTFNGIVKGGSYCVDAVRAPSPTVCARNYF